MCFVRCGWAILSNTNSPLEQPSARNSKADKRYIFNITYNIASTFVQMFA
jgi:hypothetical protein